MHQNLKVSLDRADELFVELSAEYDRSLDAKKVSPRAEQLTHEVCERLRSVLDRLARRYWDTHIAPQLPPEDVDAATVYFPIVNDRNALDSILGRWRWKSVRQQHQEIYDYLLAQQPFSNEGNKWLTILNDLAVQGKHIDLVPQVRVEEQRITVSKQGGGAVSWNPGNVRFGGGVSIMGAPIDPRTQRIAQTPGIIERLEKWVSFLVSGHGINALGFCGDTCRNTRQIVEDMSQRFGL